MNDVTLDILRSSNHKDSIPRDRHASAQENLFVNLEDFLLLKGHVFHRHIVQDSKRMLSDEIAVLSWIVASKWLSAY